MNSIINTIFAILLWTTIVFLTFLYLWDVSKSMNTKITWIPVNVSSDYTVTNFTYTGSNVKWYNAIFNIKQGDKKIHVLDLNPVYEWKELGTMDLSTLKVIFQDKMYSYYGVDWKAYHTRYYQ